MSDSVEGKNVPAPLPDLPPAAAAGRALALSPDKARDAILDHPGASAVVNALADQDFYLLIRELGPGDSLELLGLASNEKWQRVLDLALWDRDRFDHAAYGRWLQALDLADPERLAAFVIDDEAGFFRLWLADRISVALLEEDDDPTALPGEYFTLDNTFFVSVLPLPNETDEQKAEREQLIQDVLQRVAERDFAEYQRLLLGVASVIPSEAEEEAFRKTGMRVAELGFVPYDEALGLYGRLDPERLAQAPKKQWATDRDPGIPVPAFTGALFSAPFSQALERISDTHVLAGLSAEFAALCNQILSADQVRVEGRADLDRAVRKACGYLSLGLSLAAGEDRDLAAELLKDSRLTDLFQVGYGRALDLAFEARRFRKEAWFTAKGLPLTFFPEEWVGVLGGLLLKRPLCFDNLESGRLYREFESEADLIRTREVLDQAKGLDRLLGRLDLPPGWRETPGLTAVNLVLTLWVRDFVGVGGNFGPLTAKGLKGFFRELFEAGPSPRSINPAMGENLAETLARRGGMEPDQVRELAGAFLSGLMGELAAEYGAVDEKDLDPRFMPHFLCEARD